MPILDLFSKRQKRLRGEFPDVYQYHDIPQELRAQLIHVFRDVLGDPNGYESKTLEAFDLIHQSLCREYGRFILSELYRTEGPRSAIFDFMMKAPVDEVLNFLEFGIAISRVYSDDWHFSRYSAPQMTVDQAIEEINGRFRERGVGFRLEGDRVIRVDSQVLHQEAVRPALHLLTVKKFKAADEEYLEAHAHYRAGRYKESMVECLKSLESTLKVIVSERGWILSETHSISRLLDTVFQNNLLPAALQSEFTALRSTLESGVPTLRNRLAGHGQGTKPVEVPEYIASYLIHLTAASILLLVRAHEERQHGV